MQEETQKWAVGERKESLQWSLINFPFHPRNLRTLQSVKTVTTIVPQIRKVTTAWNSVRPILGSQYSIGNPSLSLVQLRENHIKWDRLLWGLKQVLGSNNDTLRTKFDTQLTLISHRRRKRLSSSAGLLFGVSSAITDRTQDLAIRASCFYVSVKI